jgi:hypothetical protein
MYDILCYILYYYYHYLLLFIIFFKVFTKKIIFFFRGFWYIYVIFVDFLYCPSLARSYTLNIFLFKFTDILYKTFYNVFSVYICDSCRFSLLSFILSFLPLLFLSIYFSYDNSYLSLECNN